MEFHETSNGRSFLSTTVLITVVVLFCILIMTGGMTTSRCFGSSHDATERPSPDSIEKIRHALTFTDREKLLLAGVQDGSDSVEQAGFYLLMGKIAKFPQLSEVEEKQLDAPAYANLLREPERYRYRPVRLAVRVYQVEKLTAENGKVSSSPYWPGQKPMWAIYGLLGDGNDVDQPIILYSAVEPPNLPEPDNVHTDGKSEFKGGLQYDAAGVFFKYIETADADKKLPRKYPAVLAWQLTAKPSQDKVPMARQILTGIIFLCVVLCLAVFIFLKRKIKSATRTRPALQYRPFESESDMADEDTEATAVDPDLTKAANEYRREHGLDEE